MPFASVGVRHMLLFVPLLSKGITTGEHLPSHHLLDCPFASLLIWRAVDLPGRRDLTYHRHSCIVTAFIFMTWGK